MKGRLRMAIRCLKDENDRLRAENNELSRTCDELHEMYGATCQCGHVMQLVRPGKYQCLACEEIAELKQSRQNISYDFESFIKDVIDLSVEKYTQADVDYLQSEIERLKNTIDHKEKLLCDYEGMISNAIEEIENAQLIDNTPKEAAVVRGELLNIFTGENEVSDAHTT